MRNKRLIFILRAGVLFFAGLVVSLAIALSQVDLETLRRDITATLQAETGLPIEIGGKISWKFSLRPRVMLTDVRVTNAEWAKNRDGIRIDILTATLDLFSLLGKPAIDDMRLTDMKVYLEYNDKGHPSFEPIAKDSESAESDNTFPYSFDFGIKSVELVMPKIAVIRPSGRTDWNFDYIKMRMRQNDAGIEFSGLLEKDNDSYSYLALFSPLDADRKVYPVRIAVASRNMPVVINAALEKTSKIPIDFIIKGKVADLRAAGNLFGLDLPSMPEMDMNISGGFGHKKLTIHKSSVNAGASDASVSGVVDWSGPRPHISAKVKSKRIDLMELFPSLYAPPKKKWVRPKRPLNVFKDIPLYSEQLNLADLDAKLDVGEVNIYRNFAVRNIAADIKVKDAVANIRGDLDVAGGRISAGLRAADYNGELRVRAAGRGDGVVVGKILESLAETNFISGLPMGFEFYLESSGRDLSELMANVTGPLRAFSTDGGYALADASGYVYGKDFLTALRHNVTDAVTRKKGYEKIKINCAAVNFKLRRGLMETTRGIAMETAEVNLRGQGFVDLGKEKLRAQIVATPVRGLKISMTNNVVNSMEFEGSMAEPDLRVNGGAIAGRAAAATGVGLLLAPFTGGVSLVAGAGIGFLTSDLLGNWLADDHPCQTALESGAPSQKGDPEFLGRPAGELVDEMLGTGH